MFLLSVSGLLSFPACEIHKVLSRHIFRPTTTLLNNVRVVFIRGRNCGSFIGRLGYWYARLSDYVCDKLLLLTDTFVTLPTRFS